MIIITNYTEEYNLEKEAHYIITVETMRCPKCNGELKKNGRPKRTLKKADGTTQILKVQRYKCETCNASHRELPDTIVPYKRMERAIIEQIINGESTIDGQEESTILQIKAWWSALTVYIQWYASALKERIGVCISPVIGNLAQIVRALANTNLWPSPRSNVKPNP
jgi:transposase-like protein